jgi:hypothetical protein
MSALYGPAIWRVCLKDEEHPNSFNRPADMPAMIYGPHHHSWPDNRRFARANRLPPNLENARPLPAEVRTFDQAFAWFLDVLGIEPPAWGYPSWPERTTLL